MGKKEFLKVTAKYGSLEYSETAWSYNENVHEEQVETCLENITRKIVDDGKGEMLDAFNIEEEIDKE